MGLIEEFEIGAKDTETPVKAKEVEIEGVKEIEMELGYPVPPVKLWFDKESLDDFIRKLRKMKEVL